jgi:glycosyltransferase involved in cell wall biosynthesis
LIRLFVFGRLDKLFGLLLGALRGVPPRFATRVNLRAAREVAALVAGPTYDIVWMEFSQSCWLLPLVVKSASEKVKKVLSLHDIQSELVQRKSKLERVLFERWTRSYERKLIRMANLVRIQSTKDELLVRRLAGPDVRSEVVAPAMSEFVYSIKRELEQIQPNSLLFWGAMNRSENYSAALWFARHVFPDVAVRFPGAVLFIVGSNPPRQLRDIASDSIIVTGFLEDPTPYFLRASLGVAPLTEGAGIKVKTLEMLAAGLRVVSTPIGAEGIPESDNLIVTEIQDMARAIAEVWSSQG